jgi:hypothetical protein
MIKLRKLTAAEVTFEVTTEHEVCSVEGHFATDEPELDRKLEAEIIERLNNGDDSAWCCVVVHARWNGYEGWDCLGGCSLDDNYTLETVVEEHGMREEALDHLNRRIAEHAAKLDALEVAELSEVTQ